MSEITEQRIDLTLYTLRFFKTRALAAAQVQKGRIKVNGIKVMKASKKIHLGDVIVFKFGVRIVTIRILGLTSKRPSAQIAQALYEILDEFRLDQQLFGA